MEPTPDSAKSADFLDSLRPVHRHERAAADRDRIDGQSLADSLNSRVFAGASLETIEPDPADVAGFDAYVQRFSAGLPIERAAVANT